ncbi:hypothetical protein [Acetobacter papayae]|uniref:hypothetical protein n=1 Tax=Acetobacter papayae TaxID=1076592 RepID=UPI00131F1608|nr:hypothetical protein [Acetobacter papayae]
MVAPLATGGCAAFAGAAPLGVAALVGLVATPCLGVVVVLAVAAIAVEDPTKETADA